MNVYHEIYHTMLFFVYRYQADMLNALNEWQDFVSEADLTLADSVQQPGIDDSCPATQWYQGLSNCGGTVRPSGR